MPSPSLHLAPLESPCLEQSQVPTPCTLRTRFPFPSSQPGFSPAIATGRILFLGGHASRCGRGAHSAKCGTLGFPSVVYNLRDMKEFRRWRDSAYAAKEGDMIILDEGDAATPM